MNGCRKVFLFDQRGIECGNFNWLFDKDISRMAGLFLAYSAWGSSAEKRHNRDIIEIS